LNNVQKVTLVLLCITEPSCDSSSAQVCVSGKETEHYGTGEMPFGWVMS